MTVTLVQPNSAPADQPPRPRSDGDQRENGMLTTFAELFGVIQSAQGTGGPLSPLATTDTPAPGGNSGGSRGARLTLLRREDETYRRSGPGRIAAVNTPQSAPARDKAPSAQGNDARPAGAEGGRALSPERDSSRGSRPTVQRASPVRTPATQPAGKNGTERQSPPPLPTRPSSRSAPAKSATPQVVTPQNPAGNTVSPPPVVDAASTAAPKTAAHQADGAARARTQAQPNGVTAPAQRAKDVSRSGDAVRPRPAAHPTSGRTDSPQRAAFDRITKLIQSGSGNRETTVRVALDPPGLGHVRVELRLRNDTLTVRLAAEDGDARRVLLSQADDLKASLEQHGVKVQRMDFPSLRSDGETGQPFDDRGSDPGAPSQSGAGAHGRGQGEPNAGRAAGAASPSGTIDDVVDQSEPAGTAPEDVRLDIRV